MMTCSSCGFASPQGAQFCSQCGCTLTAAPAAAPPAGDQAAAQMPPTGGAATGARTQTGLQPNVAGLLCYLAGWLTGLIFLLIEKDRFVRFHALQSIITFGGLTVLRIAISIMAPLAVDLLLSSLISLATLVLWVVLMVKAYNGQWFKLPIAGDVAQRHATSA